jgi:bacteriorhodopsin
MTSQYTIDVGTATLFALAGVVFASGIFVRQKAQKFILAIGLFIMVVAILRFLGMA